MAIFDPAVLNLFAIERSPGKEEVEEKLRRVLSLMNRWRDGSLGQLSETRVEQSFNERLFAEVFDYRTLYRHGAGEYHLDPKARHPNGRYDDFVLGFFSPSGRHPRASAELKDPDFGLDTRQSGKNYGGLTPVQQAFRTAGSNPAVRWILVSNFNEVRLYHASTQDRYERIVLSDVISVGDLRRAWALLSRSTLIGENQHEDSPLDRLKAGGCVVTVPPARAQVRLVHQVAFKDASAGELAFHVMDEALRRGLASTPTGVNMWPLRHPVASPRAVVDRLIIDELVQGKPMSTIELSRSGVLRVSEYLNKETESQGGRAVIQAEQLPPRVAGFLLLAHTVAGKLYDGCDVSGQYTWQLLDIEGAICGTPSGWLDAPSTSHAAPSGVTYSTVPPQGWSAAFARLPLAHHTTFVVRELLFPFEARSPGTGAVSRINPNENSIMYLLDQIPELKV